jgi:hypothetical protein
MEKFLHSKAIAPMLLEEYVAKSKWRIQKNRMKWSFENRC